MSRIRKSKRYSLVALLIVPQIFAASGLHATDLRGRIETRNVAGYVFPKPGTTVVLYRYEAGKWVQARQVQSGSDGMYYFPGVPPGSYGLQAGGLNYPITVTTQPYQDIQEIVVP